MMKLSVAIPTYNGADTILEAITSIDQEGVDEIVISDNCSTNNVEDLILSLNNPRIHYYRNTKNLGFDRNCDLAVQRSTGDYVWLFSDDEIMKPGSVMRVREIIEKDPDIAVVTVNHGISDYTMKTHFIEFYNPHKYCIMMSGLDDFLKETWKTMPLISSNIVNRNLWLKEYASYKSGYIHVEKILGILRSGKSYYIGDSLMIYRGGHPSYPANFYTIVSHYPRLLRVLYRNPLSLFRLSKCTAITLRSLALYCYYVVEDKIIKIYSDILVGGNTNEN